ncbi:MAG: hypothetical protein ABI594_02830 [Ginsengibacter sp.]
MPFIKIIPSDSPSLKNYILVSSTEYALEIYTRKENNEWMLHTSKEKNSHIHISAIDCDLALADIYAQATDLVPSN